MASVIDTPKPPPSPYGPRSFSAEPYASFILILLAQKQKQDFNAKLPRLDMCDVELPALAYGTYDFPAGAKLRRVRGNDDSCGDSKFFLEFYDSNDASASPVAGTTGTCTDN